MPPRKSNVSAVSHGDQEGASSPPRAHKEGTSIEELTLPRSIVGRLAKGILPPNTNIGKDALLAMHKSATVFVSYIAANANENAQASGKKTIMPPDVVQALKDGDFTDFLPRLEAELKKYNDTQCDKRNSYRRRVKEEKAAATSTTEDGVPQDGDVTTDSINGTTNGHADDDSRPAKKAKGENGSVLPMDGEGDLDDSYDMNGEQDDEEEEQFSDDDDDDGDDGDDVPYVSEDEEEMEDDPGKQLEDRVEQEDEPSTMRDEALDGDESD